MTITAEETVSLLADVPLFAGLASTELAELAKVAGSNSFIAGEKIFREGDNSEVCYILHRGRVRAIRENADGRTITLATLGPGEFFGELAMFDHETRSATVEAIDNVDAVTVTG